MELDDKQPLNERNPHSLKLTVTGMGNPEEGNLCGIVNSGFWGMNIVKGDWYDVSFHARAEENRSVGMVFSLETEGGKVCAMATLPEIGRGGWREYKLSLHAYDSDPKCRLVITPVEPVTMWLDVVSLFPRKTFKNRPNGMRVDVAQALADMKPGFLRFPGAALLREPRSQTVSSGKTQSETFHSAAVISICGAITATTASASTNTCSLPKTLKPKRCTSAMRV